MRREWFYRPRMSRTWLVGALLLYAGSAVAQPAPETPPPTEPAPPPPGPAPAPVVPVVVEPPPPEPTPEPETWTFDPGFFVQPQYRMRENETGAQNDTDGFRFARARVLGTATTHAGHLELSAYFEAEMQPAFQMVFAYATAARKIGPRGKVVLDLGQTRVPISRQNLLSDTMLSFVDKAQVATLAPDHDLGARLWFTEPNGRARAVISAFNGEGRDQVQNIDEHYLFAGRLEVTPLGKDPMRESSMDGDFVTIAASVGRNKLTPGGKYREVVSYVGGDVAGAWKGISGEFEYLFVHHEDEGSMDNLPDPSHYNANGWNAQLAYMLPLELPHDARVELAGRVEEIDRNDAVPIVSISDPTNQSVREYTAALSYYLRKHAIKAQLAASHFTEIEDRTATGATATYPNDQLLLQVTYRIN